MNITPVDFRCSCALGVAQFSTASHDTFQYISVGVAMKDELIKLREVGDTGSVNHIFVLNDSELPVFIMDGDILLGAKQNRVVNTSILLASESKTTIPVSCIESGRWRNVSPFFRASAFAAPLSLRFSKSRQVSENLYRSRGHASDQGLIWNMVSELHESHNTSSPTESLSDLFDSRESEFTSFVEGFTATAGANALAIFRGHELLSVDIFNRGDVYAEYFGKILRGAAVDLFPTKREGPALEEAEAFHKTAENLDTLEALPRDTHAGVSMGTEHRFADDERVGFSLYCEEHLIHFNVIRNERDKRIHL